MKEINLNVGLWCGKKINKFKETVIFGKTELLLSLTSFTFYSNRLLIRYLIRMRPIIKKGAIICVC